MITENLSTLKINKLTRAQDEAALEAGKINDNELYMIPEENADALATIGYVDEKSSVHLSFEATSEDGQNYNVTIPGIKELVVGMSINIIPKMTATSDLMVKLNLNNLGAKPIRRRTTGGAVGIKNFSHVFRENLPIKLTLIGSNWAIDEFAITDAEEMVNAVLIENGGTGAETAEEARINLGAASSADVDLLKKNWGTITIPVSGWSSTQTDGWYTNQVAVTGMTADYNPYADVVYTSSATVSDEDSAFGCIKEIETGAGVIIAKAIELPTIDVKIRLMGV